VDGLAEAEEGCARVGAAACGEIVAGCWAGLRAILTCLSYVLLGICCSVYAIGFGVVSGQM
jgi:hypothetical protein